MLTCKWFGDALASQTVFSRALRNAFYPKALRLGYSISFANGSRC